MITNANIASAVVLIIAECRVWKRVTRYALDKNIEKDGLNRDLNPGPLAPKARIIPLDHWALYNRFANVERGIKISGSGGIRTHAPEETGALNQRLRPLGHATSLLWKMKKARLAIPLGARPNFAFSAIGSECGEKKIILPDRESNPGLPRDRRRSSPLDYRGCDVGSFTKKQTRTIFMAGDYRKI